MLSKLALARQAAQPRQALPGCMHSFKPQEPRPKPPHTKCSSCPPAAQVLLRARPAAAPSRLLKPPRRLRSKEREQVSKKQACVLAGTYKDLGCPGDKVPQQVRIRPSGAPVPQQPCSATQTWNHASTSARVRPALPSATAAGPAGGTPLHSLLWLHDPSGLGSGRPPAATNASWSC